ncbi:hypothetical protein ACFOG5_17135 [Pedobacter fastidiosus]|uniref:Outer membrane lipoprotein-sorting protein n=1 Tax=Pedobacter fastidiosus TaxID=2765361 RepID=A0ABR7KRH7_9SPHI|nr:hypothetical protein [Pedobacter fastidiosus]MBC6110689.1 hypothetical protein [Pedobacter fastidiosus]
MKKTNKYSALLITISMGLFGAVYAGTRLFGSTAVQKPEAELEAPQRPDSVLVQKFLKILAFTSTTLENQEFNGSITVSDGADSSQSFRERPYAYKRSGNSFYCMMGKTETAYEGGRYVYVDHIKKKMMVGTGAKQSGASILPDANKLIGSIVSENYRIIDLPAGIRKRRISLLNPNHVTCRAYEVTYDALTLRPVSISIRLDNPGNPYNDKLDRVLTFRFLPNPPVIREGGSLKSFVQAKGNKSFSAAAKYRDYEVIEMP